MGGSLGLAAGALVGLSWALPFILIYALWSGRTRVGLNSTGAYAILMAGLFGVLAFEPLGKGRGGPPAYVIIVCLAAGLAFLISGIEMLAKARFEMRLLLCAVSLVTFFGSLFIVGIRTGIAVLGSGYYGMGAPLFIAPPAVIAFLLIESSKESIGI